MIIHATLNGSPGDYYARINTSDGSFEFLTVLPDTNYGRGDAEAAAADWLFRGTSSGTVQHLVDNVLTDLSFSFGFLYVLDVFEDHLYVIHGALDLEKFALDGTHVSTSSLGTGAFGGSAPNSIRVGSNGIYVVSLNRIYSIEGTVATLLYSHADANIRFFDFGIDPTTGQLWMFGRTAFGTEKFRFFRFDSAGVLLEETWLSNTANYSSSFSDFSNNTTYWTLQADPTVNSYNHVTDTLSLDLFPDSADQFSDARVAIGLSPTSFRPSFLFSWGLPQEAPPPPVSVVGRPSLRRRQMDR